MGFTLVQTAVNSSNVAVANITATYLAAPTLGNLLLMYLNLPRAPAETSFTFPAGFTALTPLADNTDAGGAQIARAWKIAGAAEAQAEQASYTAVNSQCDLICLEYSTTTSWIGSPPDAAVKTTAKISATATPSITGAGSTVDAVELVVAAFGINYVALPTFGTITGGFSLAQAETDTDSGGLWVTHKFEAGTEIPTAGGTFSAAQVGIMCMDAFRATPAGGVTSPPNIVTYG